MKRARGGLAYAGFGQIADHGLCGAHDARRPRICTISRSSWSTTASIWKSSSAETATLIGGKVNVIESTAALRKHLATDSSDVNMVMVHKFKEREELPVPHASCAEALGTLSGHARRPATFGVVNPSERIILHDRRGAPHPGLRPWRQSVRGFSQRHPHRLHRHAADHRAPRREGAR